MRLVTNLLAIDVITVERRQWIKHSGLKFNIHLLLYIHLVQLNISVIIISETNHLSLNGLCRFFLMDANLLTLMPWSKSSVKAMVVSIQPAAKCPNSISVDIQQSYFHLSVMTALMSIYVKCRSNQLNVSVQRHKQKTAERQLLTTLLLIKSPDINEFGSISTLMLNPSKMVPVHDIKNVHTSDINQYIWEVQVEVWCFFVFFWQRERTAKKTIFNNFWCKSHTLSI